MDKKAIREMLFASAMYSLGSILGPLLICGGLGMVFDKIFSSSPWGLLISILIAFVFTNILLFRKLGRINKLIDSYKTEPASGATVEKKIDGQA